jgi:hypothetical protein
MSGCHPMRAYSKQKLGRRRPPPLRLAALKARSKADD